MYRRLGGARAVHSNYSNRRSPADGVSKTLLAAAYRLADEFKEDVLVVKPPDGSIPFLMLASEAEPWHRDVGKLVTWRVQP